MWHSNRHCGEGFWVQRRNIITFREFTSGLFYVLKFWEAEGSVIEIQPAWIMLFLCLGRCALSLLILGSYTKLNLFPSTGLCGSFGWSIALCTKGSQVKFLIREHTLVVGFDPFGVCIQKATNECLSHRFFSLSLFFPLSQKKKRKKETNPT